MDTTLKEAEKQFALLLSEAGTTLVMLAEHVRLSGFEHDYVTQTFLRCHDQLSDVRLLGELIIQMRKKLERREEIDQPSRFEDYPGE